jgi:uncharacterized protein (DUF736 family)|tara:strand:+ start:3049 stop:3249 length:201 start_codon:yes stop_codon:yes gene_type:complete
MKLKAILEVNIILEENESIDQANSRVIEKLIDVCDEWINDKDGVHPYIKIQYQLPDEYIEEMKLMN